MASASRLVSSLTRVGWRRSSFGSRWGGRAGARWGSARAGGAAGLLAAAPRDFLVFGRGLRSWTAAAGGIAMWRGLQFVVEGGDREMRPAVDWAMRAFPEAAVDAAGSAVHVMVRSSGDGEPVGVSIRRAPEESQTVVSLMGSVRAQTVGWVVLMKQHNAPMNCTPMKKAVAAIRVGPDLQKHLLAQTTGRGQVATGQVATLAEEAYQKVEAALRREIEREHQERARAAAAGPRGAVRGAERGAGRERSRSRPREGPRDDGSEGSEAPSDPPEDMVWHDGAGRYVVHRSGRDPAARR